MSKLLQHWRGRRLIAKTSLHDQGEVLLLSAVHARSPWIEFGPVRWDCSVHFKPPLEPELIDKRSALPGEPPSLAQVQFLAQLMDSAVEIPGLRMGVGLGAILGLLPGVGDLASSFVSVDLLQGAVSVKLETGYSSAC